jgi:hypothetical protein
MVTDAGEAVAGGGSAAEESRAGQADRAITSATTREAKGERSMN